MRNLVISPLLVLLLVGLVASEEKKSGSRYALLIGVSKYDSTHLNDLDFADKDVDDLAGVLRASGYKSKDITTLNTTEKEQSPTAKRIREEISRFLAREYRKEDVVLIAFSGHGVQIGEKFYFCPRGAKVDDVKGLISIDDLYQQLRECKAGYRIVLTDTCRNDPARKAPPIPLRDPPKPSFDRGLPEDVVLFSSCAPGQKSFESKEFGRGVFFHFVVEGLKGKADLDGDNKVTRAELEAYLRVAMAKHDRKQTPQVVTRTTQDPALVDLSPAPLGGVPAPVTRIGHPVAPYRSPRLAINSNFRFAASQLGETQMIIDLDRRRMVQQRTIDGTSSMCGIQFTRNGLVVLRVNHGVGICSPLAGKLLGTFKLKPPNQPQVIALSRDEKRYAVGDSHGMLTIFDPRGPILETFDHGRMPITMAAFSADGDQILSGTERGRVILWDIGKGRQVHDLEGHKGTLLGGVISRDGTQAFTVCTGGKLIRWNLEKGRMIDETEVSLGSETPYSAAFTADGRRLMLSGKAGTISFWDIPTSGPAKMRISHEHHKSSDTHVAIAADGSRAISVGGEVLWLYEVPKE